MFLALFFCQLASNTILAVRAFAEGEKVEKDDNGNNQVDTWFFYDDNGRLTSVEEDTNKDGIPDIWEKYDESEALVLREKDLDFDGTADITDYKADSQTEICP